MEMLLSAILVLISIYFLFIRNTLCFWFRVKTRLMFYQANVKRIIKDEPEIECKLPSYFSMVFSFKSFRLESYFSKETIELITKKQ